MDEAECSTGWVLVLRKVNQGQYLTCELTYDAFRELPPRPNTAVDSLYATHDVCGEE